MSHEYHVIYSVRYYPQFHVAEVGLGMFYLISLIFQFFFLSHGKPWMLNQWMWGHTCMLNVLSHFSNIVCSRCPVKMCNCLYVTENAHLWSSLSDFGQICTASPFLRQPGYVHASSLQLNPSVWMSSGCLSFLPKTFPHFSMWFTGPCWCSSEAWKKFSVNLILDTFILWKNDFSFLHFTV
jgi:hypothetical protein